MNSETEIVSDVENEQVPTSNYIIAQRQIIILATHYKGSKLQFLAQVTFIQLQL